jgi:hypothetical protein
MIRLVLFPLLTLLLSAGISSDRWEVTRSASRAPLSAVSEQVFVPVSGLDKLDRYHRADRDLWLRQELSPEKNLVLLFKGWPAGTTLYYGEKRVALLSGIEPESVTISGKNDWLYIRIPGDSLRTWPDVSLAAGSGLTGWPLLAVPVLADGYVRFGAGCAVLFLLLLFMILGLSLKKDRRFVWILPAAVLFIPRLLQEGSFLIHSVWPELLTFLAPVINSPAFGSALLAFLLTLFVSLAAALSLKKPAGVLIAFLTAVLVTAVPVILNIRAFSQPSLGNLFGLIAAWGYPGLLVPAALFLIIFPLAVKRNRGIVAGGVLLLLAGVMAAVMRLGVLPESFGALASLAGWTGPLWYLHLLLLLLIPLSALAAKREVPVPVATETVTEPLMSADPFEMDLPADPEDELVIPLNDAEEVLFEMPPEEPTAAAGVVAAETAAVIPPVSLSLTGETVLNLQKGLAEKRSLFDPLWEVACDHPVPEGSLQTVYADILRSGKGNLSGCVLMEIPPHEAGTPAGALAILVLKTGLLESLREDLPLAETARRLHRMLRDSFPGQEPVVAGHILRLSIINRGGLVEGISFGGTPVLYRNGRSGRVTVLNTGGTPLGSRDFSGKPLKVWRMVLAKKDLLCLFSKSLAELKQKALDEPLGLKRFVRFFKAGGAGRNGYAEETLTRMVRETAGFAGRDKHPDETAFFVLRARV